MSVSVVTHRRNLHRIPELDNQLTETAAYVRAALEVLPCAVTTPISCGICAKACPMGILEIVEK